MIWKHAEPRSVNTWAATVGGFVKPSLGAEKLLSFVVIFVAVPIEKQPFTSSLAF